MGYQYYDSDDIGGRRGGFLSQIPVVTRNIIIINILFYLATLAREDFMLENFSLFYPLSPFFHIWQPLTHMFMHGGFMHLFFNMYSLLLFGSVTERSIGSRKFLVFYLLTGICAALLHIGYDAGMLAIYNSNANYVAIQRLLCSPMLGASGAIYGVIMGYAMLYPNSTLTLIFPPVSLKAKWMVLIFAGIELGVGIMGTSDGIAHLVHLGGLLFGWALMFFWKKTGRLYNTRKWF